MIKNRYVRWGMWILICGLWINKLISQSYPWNQKEAKPIIEGTIDLEWAPLPFVFQKGDQIRYIDPEKGNDDLDGKTPNTAWRHHPWDLNAPIHLRNQNEVDTYIFKKGTIYRGCLISSQSGKEKNPIRLTSDPGWGQGEAILSGSERIQGGWRKVHQPQNLRFPQTIQGTIWETEIPPGTYPMLMWQISPKKEWIRLPIAREPNWKESDPYRPAWGWWTWEETQQGFPQMIGKDPAHLSRFSSLKGAVLWTDCPVADFNWNLPEPGVITEHDPVRGVVKFGINHPGKFPRKGSRYYLENHPILLDQPGEWWYDASSKKIYLCVNSSEDPNILSFEIARQWVILEIKDQSHIEISGLTFVGGNSPDPSSYDKNREGMTKEEWIHFQMGAVRLRGKVTHVSIHHCKFYNSSIGITGSPERDGDLLDKIFITDNEFQNIDYSAIELSEGVVWRETPIGKIQHVEVLRNRIENVKGRYGIGIGGMDTGRIAGNIVHRTGGQGINIFAGKEVGGIDSQLAKMGEVPLVRIFIHHNKVTESLRYCQDFGGIESWGGGPVYVYNNISAIPVGWIPSNGWFHKNQCFYFDHQFKGYLFNNVGWGIQHPDAWHQTMSAAFLHQAEGFLTYVFHNTAYQTRSGFYRDTGIPDRDYFLGNLIISATSGFMGHPRLKDNPRVGYAHNVFVGNPQQFFSVWQENQFSTLIEFQTYLRRQNAIQDQVGWHLSESPVEDLRKYDFRPKANSPLIDRGVKVFVPFGLARVVGEWHFLLYRTEPSRILGENFYLTTDHTQGNKFHLIPRNDLVGKGIDSSQYTLGNLENWTLGALALKGEQVLYQDPEQGNHPATNLDMTTNNFLIEAVVLLHQIESPMTIVEKIDPNSKQGYRIEIAQKRLKVELFTEGNCFSLETSTILNTQQWYHILTEVDRSAQEIRVYLDGQHIQTQKISNCLPSYSLTNQGIFTVGKKFVGVFDFLRVAKGTLADAQTTIEELYAWQFNGPHYHDFANNPIQGKSRDVGAIERF